MATSNGNHTDDVDGAGSMVAAWTAAVNDDADEVENEAGVETDDGLVDLAIDVPVP